MTRLKKVKVSVMTESGRESSVALKKDACPDESEVILTDATDLEETLIQLKSVRISGGGIARSKRGKSKIKTKKKSPSDKNKKAVVEVKQAEVKKPMNEQERYQHLVNNFVLGVDYDIEVDDLSQVQTAVHSTINDIDPAMFDLPPPKAPFLKQSSSSSTEGKSDAKSSTSTAATNPPPPKKGQTKRRQRRVIVDEPEEKREQQDRPDERTRRKEATARKRTRRKKELADEEEQVKPKKTIRGATKRKGKKARPKRDESEDIEEEEVENVGLESKCKPEGKTKRAKKKPIPKKKVPAEASYSSTDSEEPDSEYAFVDEDVPLKEPEIKKEAKRAVKKSSSPGQALERQTTSSSDVPDASKNGADDGIAVEE